MKHNIFIRKHNYEKKQTAEWIRIRKLTMDEQKIDTILDGFYRSKSQKTALLYQSDLAAFSQYLGVGSLKKSLVTLFQAPHSQANLTVLHYKSLMQRQGLKPATINRRLSALRSLAKAAYLSGLLDWKLDVNNDKIVSGHKNLPLESQCFNALLAQAGNQANPRKAARDTAIIRLMHDLALHRSSIVGLNVSDIDSCHNLISVSLPGVSDKIDKRLPIKTAQTLQQWLSFRGRKKGPLFTNCDHAGKGKRLTGTSIYRIVRQFGREVGVETGPCGIRQTAIFKAIHRADAAGIRLEDVTAFSNHRNVSTLKTYDKHRVAIQQRLSELIAK